LHCKKKKVAFNLVDMLLTLHRNEVFSEVIKFRRMGMWTDKRA